MKIIFMGTPNFSVGTLEALVEAGHDVCLTVTQPDKPKGRGKEMQFTPVKEAALRLGIPVYQPKRVREAECVEELRKYQADVMVVVAFGQILPEEILGMTPYGCINVHASLLPKYRGAAPIQWSIISGEQVTGVTTMQMDAGLDTGDMLLKTEVAITAEETGESLHDKTVRSRGRRSWRGRSNDLRDGTLGPEKQGESPTPYAKMLDKKMGNIDWTRPAAEIERLVRGLDSWPSAYTHWDKKVMKIWKAKVVSQADFDATIDVLKKTVPGTVVTVEKEHFLVQTGDGLLAVEELQITGKKRMETSAFLRGYTFEEGTVLTDGSKE